MTPSRLFGGVGMWIVAAGLSGCASSSEPVAGSPDAGTAVTGGDALARVGAGMTAAELDRAWGPPAFAVPGPDGAERRVYLRRVVERRDLRRDPRAREPNWVAPVFVPVVEVRHESIRWSTVDLGPDGRVRDVRDPVAVVEPEGRPTAE